MLVVEAKLKNGTPEQYALLDQAILTGQFVRNKCVRYWMDNKGVTRNDLQKLCSVLTDNKETPWVKKLNSQARQSSADRAWQSIQRFYQNCRAKISGKKGYPRFKKYSRTVKDRGRRRRSFAEHNAAINILKKGLQYLGRYLNGTVGHTGTDPNALGEFGLWVVNGDINDLSRLVEQGISNSDVERIPRQIKDFVGGVCQL